MSASFINSLFPLPLSAIDSQDTWEDTIIEMGGGSEQRVVLWSDSKKQYNLATAENITQAQLNSLRQHFNAMRARRFGFPLLDTAFHLALNAGLGTAGAGGSTMQLTVNDGNGDNAYNREIYLPKTGTVVVKANTVTLTETTDYTIAYTGATGGVLTWVNNFSGQAITWSGTFYIPVRYDVKEFPAPRLFISNADGTGVAKGPSLPLKEIRYTDETFS